MITWPATLPKPNRDFSTKVGTSAIRTQMDSGRFRQRPRFTRALRTIPVVWTLTDDDYYFFQGIYQHTLNQGCDWFTISLPLGDGFKDYTARFLAGSGYEAQHDQVMYWKVRATLETEDESAMDGETADALVAIGGDVDAFEIAVAELTEITEL